MRPSSKRVLVVAAALAVALVITILLRLPVPSDQDQILAQLESARAAGERHDVRGIMQVISADYHGNTSFDSNVDELHYFLSRVVGREGRVMVTLSPPSVQVHGDTADSVSQVTVRPREGGPALYDKPVALHWKKEDGTRWLVFPTKVWRVVGADYSAPGGGDEGGGLL